MRQWVVAADVGNSAVKLAVAENTAERHAPLVLQKSFRTCVSNWPAGVLDWLEGQLEQGRSTDSIELRVASVHRRAADQLCDVAVSRFANVTLLPIHHHHVPIEAAVDQPQRLGIDRLVGAYAAMERFEPPLVVVDAGSAVTVDFVDGRRVFRGGAIFPGLAMQFRALANGTDALPQAELSAGSGLPQIGQNTEQAIRLGVLTAFSACIERLCRHYAQTFELSAGLPRLIVTGGDSAVASDLLTYPHDRVDNLVCCGILDLPRSSLVGTNSGVGLE